MLPYVFLKEMELHLNQMSMKGDFLQYFWLLAIKH